MANSEYSEGGSIAELTQSPLKKNISTLSNSTRTTRTKGKKHNKNTYTHRIPQARHIP